jgi:YidC/Oxa1 family membrane protein insertase
MFNSIIITPLYNILILLVDFLTTDIGIAVVIMTVIIRLLLFPLSKNQIQTQIKFKQVQKPLEELKAKYKDQPDVMGRKMMELYKEYEIKPFSGVLLLIIQLPILFGLYYVFLRSGLPEVNSEMLYSFVSKPEYINNTFIGIFNITSKSIILAFLAGLTQWIQLRMLNSVNKDNKEVSEKKDNPMGDMMKNFQTQMTYIMPLMIAFISYSFGVIIAIYLLTGNLFSIAQEYYLRKNIRKPELNTNIQAPKS